MPLCHWPCSCYPNHTLNQTNDWMAEIYERWTAAHAVIIVTPVYWYQSPSPLKLMIDRLVCADGGNPDPTSTSGKTASKAKALEMAGWDYPKHLAGRAYGLIVHGDVAGIEGARRSLSDWLDWMGFIDAGAPARLDRFIGYYEPYATSHEALDKDERCRKKRATWRAPWPRRLSNCGRGAFRRYRRRCHDRVRNRLTGAKPGSRLVEGQTAGSDQCNTKNEVGNQRYPVACCGKPGK
jgi:multimeric flavodoxin WrbA